ncbi:RDD family protein [Mycobacterium yunnanensis]|uniref:RDD family protein n=2 Tax=Mycobacterium yunnanensis TaxID=368477 RepID=A0A9X2YHT4_9MYCO|nr:RDD family protein [Mycobacterium yunnanensis]
MVDVVPVVVLALVALALAWVTRNPLCDGDPSIRDLGSQCGDAGSTPLGWWSFVACWLAMVGYAVWNLGLRQGRGGASLGKGLLGIRVLDATTQQPIGFTRSTVRLLAHVADVVPLLLGVLWPLWDRRRQSFSDKLASTVVQRNALTPVSASPITN